MKTTYVNYPNGTKLKYHAHKNGGVSISIVNPEWNEAQRAVISSFSSQLHKCKKYGDIYLKYKGKISKNKYNNISEFVKLSDFWANTLANITEIYENKEIVTA